MDQGLQIGLEIKGEFRLETRQILFKQAQAFKTPEPSKWFLIMRATLR
jgi:hypothetical protein